MDTSKRLIDGLSEALRVPHGPADDWVCVGRSFVQEAIDHIEWIEKGNEEWRQMYVASARQAEMSYATARTAIRHLQAVLNKARTHAEQQAADTAARDWLVSIGSDPQ